VGQIILKRKHTPELSNPVLNHGVRIWPGPTGSLGHGLDATTLVGAFLPRGLPVRADHAGCALSGLNIRGGRVEGFISVNGGSVLQVRNHCGRGESGEGEQDLGELHLETCFVR